MKIQNLPVLEMVQHTDRIQGAIGKPSIVGVVTGVVVAGVGAQVSASVSPKGSKFSASYGAAGGGAGAAAGAVSVNGAAIAAGFPSVSVTV